MWSASFTTLVSVLVRACALHNDVIIELYTRARDVSQDVVLQTSRGPRGVHANKRPTGGRSARRDDMTLLYRLHPSARRRVGSRGRTSRLSRHRHGSPGRNPFRVSPRYRHRGRGTKSTCPA